MSKMLKGVVLLASERAEGRREWTEEQIERLLGAARCLGRVQNVLALNMKALAASNDLVWAKNFTDAMNDIGAHTPEAGDSIAEWLAEVGVSPEEERQDDELRAGEGSVVPGGQKFAPSAAGTGLPPSPAGGLSREEKEALLAHMYGDAFNVSLFQSARAKLRAYLGQEGDV